MSTKEQILAYLKQNPDSPSSDMTKRLQISRQAVAKHLAALLAEQLVTKTGSTKNALYKISTRKKNENSPNQEQATLKLVKKLKGLEEDRVYEELNLRLGLKRKLRKNVYSILYYAFTEMLNNAIDHSQADKVEIQFILGSRAVTFDIRDKGVGIFNNVMTQFHLNDEFSGLEHLIKGKQTTQPDRHSGQGIFFTSRIADLFELRSHKLHFCVDNKKNDLFAGDQKFASGTTVRFSIKLGSRKQIKDVFDQYANDDYQFDRSNFRIKLTADREFLSRSQAKRITTGLDSYQKLIFDFAKVKMVGQAFADEIFRIFQNRHPKIEISFCNANEAITGMILRVIRSQDTFPR